MRYDEINIGDKAEIVHTISSKDIERFVDLTGDDNKIHVDKQYASKTSFKKPVAHGMLSASFISTIIGTKIPGDGALWFSQTLEFLIPVREGDTITITAEVIDKIERLNAIELQTDIFNQNKQKVITGKAKVKIIEQQPELKESPEIKVEQNKVALIIGGSGGIGAATCLKLADSGYDIAVHYNSNSAKAHELVEAVQSKNKNAFCLSGSIEEEDSIIEMVKKTQRRLGPITLLVNCSTVKVPDIKFENITWSQVEKHLSINIKANFFLVKAISPQMKEMKFGKLIFITTQYTDGAPPNGFLPYVTAKNALNGFAKSLAVELAPFNINVNLVSPGITETDLIANMPEKIRLLTAAKIPLRRLSKVSDVANVISFLASNDSNYITGETIRVNGGQIML